ncbi:MAG: DUF6340 family protein [Tannerellaceae bacterium]|jgi:tetratricopeptide (TPR) repeat protein|nr:DUF6340 family protein [Tannerellaceae bacterium]
MKQALFTLLAMLCMFSACSGIRYMEIEMYSPAEITYPSGVRKVLIADNALPQPPDTNCVYLVGGIYREKCSAAADSALRDACRFLGKALVEANYFDDVLLLDEKLRKDSANYYIYRKIPPEEVQALCEETGADAIITFDRLIFNTKKEISKSEGYVNGAISVYVNGIAGSYLPDGAEKPVAVLVSDSIFWSEWGESEKQVNSLLPTPEEALRIAARYVSEKICAAFVPHWESGQRWIYTSSGSRWKEGTAYAIAEKWDAAAECWQQLFDKTTNQQNRARLASNLALCDELTGKLEEAHAYASTSATLFAEFQGEEALPTLLQNQYMKRLDQRIDDDRKLNLQLQLPAIMEF